MCHHIDDSIGRVVMIEENVTMMRDTSLARVMTYALLLMISRIVMIPLYRPGPSTRG